MIFCQQQILWKEKNFAFVKIQDDFCQFRYIVKHFSTMTNIMKHWQHIDFNLFLKHFLPVFFSGCLFFPSLTGTFL